MSSVVDRFIRYVKIDTQSDLDSETFPSTAKQLDLARLLMQELNALGLKDVTLDEHGYVTAKLPSNLGQPDLLPWPTRQGRQDTRRGAPAIGLMAHMDTSPDMSGANVRPHFVEHYDGGDIVLDQENRVVLSPSDFPDLKKYTGQTLITTDGTTLLGADDKAGVAEIMAALEYLVNHPTVRHGELCIGFTPDEETGRGVDYFDVKKFGADFAYTIDGEELGEVQFETFNAARARIRIHGRSVHPGTAKGKMINAALVAMELNAMLPPGERPELTDGYEGFYHLTHLEGAVEEARLDYLIRDHDRQKFEAKKAFLEACTALLNQRYNGRLSLEISDTYYNMREKIEPVMHIFETARQAITAVGLTPIVGPVRGGTDGCRLSYMGLPTPNIFTGGHNAHGKYEFIPVESMEKSVEVILKIIELYARA
jgi:tripeptide aminopeptidase